MSDNLYSRDLKELKKFYGISHEKRIVDIYLNTTGQALVETEPGRRFRDLQSEFVFYDDGRIKYYNSADKLNKDRQAELCTTNGRKVDLS